MSKRRSIIANFGAISASDASLRSPEDGTERLSRTPTQPAARVGAGVIGATQRTLTDIREERDRLLVQVAAGGAAEISPSLIDPSPFRDRLPDDTELGFDALKRLIESEGQKVPIQVRPHPTAAGRYQVAYGHRRWRAAAELGRPVKALVVELSDRDLAVAQGIENASRQDLTWIERALFAWRMDEAGMKAREIRAALGVDDAELARFRSVCRALPPDVIQGIGRAPKIGRPRWVEVAAAVTSLRDGLEKVRETLSADKISTLPSDDRFRRVLASLKIPPSKGVTEVSFSAPSGVFLGKAAFSRGDIKLTIARKHEEAFREFLAGELPSLAERFFARESGD
jgi:ParB family chromosome partitioning protein